MSPAGTRRIYRLDPVALAALRDQLDALLAASVVRVRRCRGSNRPRRVDGGDRRSDLVQQIVVQASIERAFAVFTERIGDYKPPEHNLLSGRSSRPCSSPVGGHIVDRGADGTECRWARVLAYEPPDRLVFSWDISPRWSIETDPDRTSEVEVRFVARHPRAPGWSSSTG